MVWIVGFSIGGLTIILTNLTSFSQMFSHGILKLVLVLLSASIISGIVYRWAFYLYQVQYQNIEFYLQSAFSDKEIMETDPDDLSKETDIKEIVWRLKVDFGEDLSHVLEIYEKIDANHKLLLIEDLKRHYRRTGEWAKKDYEGAIKYAKDTFRKAFGASEKKVDRLFNSNSASALKFWGRIVTIAFLISCLTFIIVLILLTILY
jgi:hypothetical protein